MLSIEMNLKKKYFNISLLVFDVFLILVQYPNYSEDHYPYLFDLNIEILDRINKLTKHASEIKFYMCKYCVYL